MRFRRKLLDSLGRRPTVYFLKPATGPRLVEPPSLGVRPPGFGSKLVRPDAPRARHHLRTRHLRLHVHRRDGGDLHSHQAAARASQQRIPGRRAARYRPGRDDDGAAARPGDGGRAQHVRRAGRCDPERRGRVLTLDRALARYGPETKPTRDLIRKPSLFGSRRCGLRQAIVTPTSLGSLRPSRKSKTKSSA